MKTATRRSPPFLIVLIRHKQPLTRHHELQYKTNMFYPQIKFIGLTYISFAKSVFFSATRNQEQQEENAGCFPALRWGTCMIEATETHTPTEHHAYC
ncbi:MAG: hypothetical protein ABF968_01980 [Acetobacter sp.]